MPTLETPPNPVPPPPEPPAPLKVRTSRFGELEEHELIHLIDALDDERSRARFRESVYISIFVYILIGWFVLYGPRWLPMGPKIVNEPIKQEKGPTITSLTVPKDLAKEFARQPKPTPPPPQPTLNNSPPPAPMPTPQAPRPSTPQPQQQAVPQQQPPKPQVSTPTPQPPTPAPPQPQQQAMVDAPKPSFQQQNQSAGSAIQKAARDAARTQNGGGAYPPQGVTRSQDPIGSGTDILTDTQGVDFSQWKRRTHSDIMRNWTPLLPESFFPPINKRGQLSIRITIMANGKIGAMTLESPSGDRALDKAAWGAIVSEGTFPPLPTAFTGPSIDMRWTFTYGDLQ